MCALCSRLREVLNHLNVFKFDFLTFVDVQSEKKRSLTFEKIIAFCFKKGSFKYFRTYLDNTKEKKIKDP